MRRSPSTRDRTRMMRTMDPEPCIFRFSSSDSSLKLAAVRRAELQWRRSHIFTSRTTSGGEGEGAARRETRAHYCKRTAHLRRTRRGSDVSGEARGLASYTNVPVPPGPARPGAEPDLDHGGPQPEEMMAASRQAWMAWAVGSGRPGRSARESGLGATCARESWPARRDPGHGPTGYQVPASRIRTNGT